jgi:FkbM family methyltransferase
MARSLASHVKSLRRRLVRQRRFPVVTTFRGAKFILDPRNWADCEIALNEPYEDEQLAFASAAIQHGNLDTLIDVGANFGLYTVLLGKLATVKRVFAFEPVRRNYAQLLGNVFANRIEDKVDAYRLALGDRKAQSIIHVDPHSTAIARFVPSLEGRDSSHFTQSEEVSVSPLDDIVLIEGARIFMKIDVEGHALAALRGMPGLLTRNEIVLQVELFDEERQETVEFLRSVGYTPAEAFGRDQYFRRSKPA